MVGRLPHTAYSHLHQAWAKAYLRFYSTLVSIAKTQQALLVISHAGVGKAATAAKGVNKA